MNLSTNKLLKEFLNVFWLRPETALWRTIDCMAMQDIKFISPILDLGCGDGLFSFIRAGGKVKPSFDMFLQSKSLENFFENVDIYNFADDVQENIVEYPPCYRIDVGLDHKPALLKKPRVRGFIIS